MFDATTRLSLPPSATALHPARAAAGAATPGAAGSRAQADAAGALPVAPSVAPSVATPPFSSGAATGTTAPRAAAQPAAAPLVRPAWPDPATVNLAAELLALSTTTIAHTLPLPETGPDFWSLLATALPEGERE